MKISLQPQPLMLPCPVLLVGTYDKDGKPNIMTAAWGGVACSIPPCVSISLREATLTYHNIISSGAFTVNFTSEKYLKEADYAGLVSGREHDKFAETGLTPEKSSIVNAPIMKEFPVSLECKLVNQVPLGSHTMFIGEVVGIMADDEVVRDSKHTDIEKVRPLIWGTFGSMGYYGIGEKLGKAFSSGKELEPK